MSGICVQTAKAGPEDLLVIDIDGYDDAHHCDEVSSLSSLLTIDCIFDWHWLTGMTALLIEVVPMGASLMQGIAHR